MEGGAHPIPGLSASRRTSDFSSGQKERVQRGLMSSYRACVDLDAPGPP